MSHNISQDAGIIRMPVFFKNEIYFFAIPQVQE